MLWWTLKGSIILALAFAATALLRRRPAAVRHAVWIIAIGAQLLLPFGPRFVPERTLAVAVPCLVEPCHPERSEGPSLVQPGRSFAVFAAQDDTAAPTPATQFDPRTILAAGSALLLLRLLFGTIRVVALSRRAQRVTDGEWLSLNNRLCDALQISRPVTLLHTDGLRMPVTWGFLYPTILLPAASREWPDALRRHVLLHELAHVRRADAFTQLLAQGALALFWFNPLLWLAAKLMRVEAENACDDYVLRDGERPSLYATTLVELVRAHTGPSLPAFATLSVGQRSDLEARVSAITNPLRDASSRRMLMATAVAVALVIVLPLSAVHPIEKEKTQPKRTATTNRIGCRPLLIDDFEFKETSGTMTANGRTTHYFFLRPEPQRCLEGSFNLDARFTAGDRDLVPTPGLQALVHETLGSVDRAVYIDEMNGALRHRYLLNGRESAWDAGAQRWYADVLPDVIRRSYAGVDDRARRILEAEGIEGVFAEVARVAIVDVRAKYLLALLALRGPDTLPRETLIARAREELDAHEPTFGMFLADVIAQEGSRDDVRAAVLAATRGIREGWSRVSVLKAMTQHSDPRVRVAAMEEIGLADDSWRRDVLRDAVPWYLGTNTALIDAWFRGLETIDKSSERAALLTHVRGQELPAGVLSRLDAEISRQ